MKAIIFIVAILLLYLFIFALFKVSGNADREMEELYEKDIVKKRRD